MASNLVYLGDSVYAFIDGISVVLVTKNGIEESNRIYLDPEVVKNFLAYIEKIKRHEV